MCMFRILRELEESQVGVRVDSGGWPSGSISAPLVELQALGMLQTGRQLQVQRQHACVSTNVVVF